MTEPHYELVELLGQGGMGSVYRAFHRPSGRAVAIKTLHTAMTTKEAASRILLDEASSAARLDDPRIVRLLDVGRQRDDTPFLVMQLARGVSLDRMIENWAGWASLSKAVMEVLAGLRSAHSAGIIHRDLKPANVIVDPEDGVARMLDFGIAKRFDPLRLEEEDPNQQVLGTPEFMPPEQMLGESTGPWTDLYAIGVVLAEVVRGEMPFRLDQSLHELVYRKQTYTGTWTTRPGLEVPDALQHLIDRLLQPLPRARPRFAGEVAGELEALARHVVDKVTHTRRISERPRAAFFELVGGLQQPSLAPFSEPLKLPAKLPAGPADPVLRASLTGLRELRLVGRNAEREELMSSVHDVAQDGQPRLLVYVGEPGIGKSRLARWGLEYVERVGAMERAAGGYDAAGADVAGGLRHALRRVVGNPPSPRNQLGWSWLQDPELDLDELTRYVRGDDRETLAVDDVVRIAHATLRAAAKLRPIYLWLDDLGWARDGAMQLVLRILNAADVPILFVATMRSGTRSHATLADRLKPLLEHPATTTRTLQPLSSRRRAELIRETANVEESIASEIAQRVEGSPLLLVQLTRDWLQRGLLVPEGEVYRTAKDASVASLLDERPLSALIRDRISTILQGFKVPDAEPILRRAALLGARFDIDALESASSRLNQTVPEVIDHALLVGLVRNEGDSIYAFDHALVREVLLDRAADDRRACVDAANGLLRRYGKERTDIAALVAELLHRAGDYERAWERLLRAITRAAWAGDDGQARHHLERAATWLEIEPGRKPQLALAEADVHLFARRYEQGLKCVARARAATTDPLLLARCDADDADILFHLGRLAESSAIAASSLAANEDDPDPDRQAIAARAAARLGALAGLRGELDEALSRHRQAMSLSKRAGDAFGVRIGLLCAARIRGVNGEPDRALRDAEKVLDVAERARDEAATLAANETIGRLLVLGGQMERARPLAHQRRRSASVRGDKARATSAALDCALVALEPAEIEIETSRFLDAFATTPHNHPSTVAAMEKLTILLVGHGMKELADEVKELLAARSERIDRGFTEV